MQVYSGIEAYVRFKCGGIPYNREAFQETQMSALCESYMILTPVQR